MEAYERILLAELECPFEHEVLNFAKVDDHIGVGWTLVLEVPQDKTNPDDALLTNLANRYVADLNGFDSELFSFELSYGTANVVRSVA